MLFRSADRIDANPDFRNGVDVLHRSRQPGHVAKVSIFLSIFIRDRASYHSNVIAFLPIRHTGILPVKQLSGGFNGFGFEPERFEGGRNHRTRVKPALRS